MRTFLCESPRAGFTNTLRRAGDQADLAVQAKRNFRNFICHGYMVTMLDDRRECPLALPFVQARILRGSGVSRGVASHVPQGWPFQGGGVVAAQALMNTCAWASTWLALMPGLYNAEPIPKPLLPAVR
jgi:hypothetical protein